MGSDAEADPLEFYRKCRQIGYCGAEMVPPERREAARGAGMALVNIAGPGMTEGLNRLENHDALLPEIIAAIEEAKNNQIGSVIVFSGNRNGQADSEGITNCAKAFRQLVPYCKRTGVSLLFEMLNSDDHVDYQADHGSYGFSLIDAVGEDCLKLIYDVYHMERAGDDYMTDIKMHLTKIGHFHCATAPKRTCTAESKTANYRRIVELAMENGYDGYFGQEFIAQGDILGELQNAYSVLVSCHTCNVG